MVQVTYLLTSILLAGNALAFPLEDEIIDIDHASEMAKKKSKPISKPLDQKLFDRLVFMEQYASAAYCKSQQSTPGNLVTCKSKTCDLVTAANATTAIEYERKDLSTDVTGFVALDPTNKLIVVSFRGTNTIANWITNLSFDQVATHLCPKCTAHRGFWQSWLDSRTAILTAVYAIQKQNPKYQIVTMGHSLGGAIAQLAAADLRFTYKLKVEAYSYGSPRIAGHELSEFITKQGDNYRVTHYNDIVPDVPKIGMGYEHVSPEYHIEEATGVPVLPKHINIFEGTRSLEGNARHMWMTVNAHMWYFNWISACTGMVKM
ncbi:unnamed protein product [Periconia digitata]|uniref:Fungal lipase-type domain-containing protein n=1 Tax=Periconia digitata TaxID=1303443 RepID=A0A9W4XL46_9PLEO|nr:unnamed protein product [Periconia digitata]